MATLELQIISELLRSKDMIAVSQLGFNENHLVGDPEAAQIFEFIRKWYYNNDTYRQFPSTQSIKRRWPSFVLLKDKDNQGRLRSLLKECITSSVENDIRSLVDFFGELVDEEPNKAVEIMQSALSRVASQSNPATGFSLQEIADSVEKQFEGAQKGTIFGIPWPWDAITNDTLGKNKGDLIVIYGRMKSMKCICKGARIMMSNGAILPIEDVPSVTTAPSFTESTGKIREASARRVASGVKDCVEVETESGLVLQSSDEHLYMVPNGGYRRIKELSTQDYIATSRSYPDWTPTSDISPEDGHLLGLLAGAGIYQDGQIQYPAYAHMAVTDRLSEHAERHSCVLAQDCHAPVARILSKGTDGSAVNGVRDLFRRCKINTKRTLCTQILKHVNTTSRDAVLGFLAGVLDTCGTCPPHRVVFNHGNLHFLNGVRHLLSRFGICGRRKQVVGATWVTHEFHVTEPYSVRTLSTLLSPLVCAHAPRLEYYKKLRAPRVPDTDIIWEKIKSIKSIGKKACFDICITDGQDPNFVVEGFIVHNTWILLKSALDDYIVHKRRVLIWSREMGSERMALRAGALLAGVDYQCLKNGTLPPPLYRKAMKTLKEMALLLERSKDALQKIKEEQYDLKDIPDLLVVCGRGAPTKLEAIDGIVEAFAPDIVYFDSMYHMETANMTKMRADHEKQRELATSFKQRALDWDIPIVGSTQANRDGEKTHGDTLADVGRTDAWGQEGDLIIRVLKKDGEAPDDEEYEGYWRRLKQKNGDAKSAKEVRRRRVRLGMSSAAKKAFSKPRNGVPGKIANLTVRIPENPRTSADIFLMMSGNREGVLQGVQLHAVPGCRLDHVKDVTYEEVKKILDDDKKSSEQGVDPKKKQKKWEAVNPAKVGVAYSEE